MITNNERTEKTEQPDKRQLFNSTSCAQQTTPVKVLETSTATDRHYVGNRAANTGAPAKKNNKQFGSHLASRAHLFQSI